MLLLCELMLMFTDKPFSYGIANHGNGIKWLILSTRLFKNKVAMHTLKDDDFIWHRGFFGISDKKNSKFVISDPKSASA